MKADREPARRQQVLIQVKVGKPIPLGKRSVGWLESELINWQRARVAERDRHHD